MTLRQLVREIMLSKGMSEEEIEERGKYASSMAPSIQVDTDLPDAAIPALRKRYSDLYDAVQQRPEVYGAWMARKTQEIRSKN